MNYQYPNIDTVVAATIGSDGYAIHPDSYAQALTYDSSGNPLTVTIVADNGATYVQTLTWTSGNLTAISKWVKQ